MKSIKKVVVVSLIMFFFWPALGWCSENNTSVDKNKIDKLLKKYQPQKQVREDRGATVVPRFESPGYYSYKLREQADKLSWELQQAREDNRRYSIIFVCLGQVLSLIIVLAFMRKTTPSANDIVNQSALVFIIFGTIIIVVIADAEQQLTASVGILGAIAGYLFGTWRRGEKETSPEK